MFRSHNQGGDTHVVLPFSPSEPSVVCQRAVPLLRTRGSLSGGEGREMLVVAPAFCSCTLELLDIPCSKAYIFPILTPLDLIDPLSNWVLGQRDMRTLGGRDGCHAFGCQGLPGA